MCGGANLFALKWVHGIYGGLLGRNPVNGGLGYEANGTTD